MNNYNNCTKHSDKYLAKQSKFLSLILRHKPQLANLKIQDGGWVSISNLLKNTNFTMKQLEYIVQSDSKQRYSFDQYRTRIRANQGHSVDVRMGFMDFIPNDYLYHGTSTKYKDSIMKDGIKKMNRQYVHLSKDIETAKNVGSRHGQPIVIKINAIKMYQDGIKFYISQNQVVLVDYVDKKYLQLIYDC